MDQNRMKLTFFDDYWIDFRRGTTRRWFKPELYSITPFGGSYSSLCCNKETGKYQIFYETMVDHGKDGPRMLRLTESEDLKTFHPVITENGDNIVFDGESGVHGSSVLLDIHDPDPSKRYKFCGMTRLGRDVEGARSHVEVVLAFSPDGIHWEHHPELVANPHTSDALNKLLFNPYTEEYCMLHRSAFVDRRISIRTSKDLVHWSEPQILLHPGTNYNDEHTQMQHYSMTAGFFDGLFYGFVWRYNTSLFDMDYSKMFGFMDAELVYSYDGREYLYTSGEPVIDRPMPPQSGWAGVNVSDMCESLDGKDYLILASGANYVHGTSETNKKFHDMLVAKGIKQGQLIYKIRKDGFCGLECVGQGGSVITKPIAFLKDDLTFNIRANCGWVRFALTDRFGKELEGFSLDECIPFEFDDSVEIRPQWKSHQLAEVLNQQLRVVIELNGAILHSMSATARPYIRQMQKSFYDPQGVFE